MFRASLTVCLAFAFTSIAGCAEPPPTPSTARSLVETSPGPATADKSATQSSPAEVSQEPGLGASISDCFCVQDRGFCRREFGTTWFCNTDPCECEPI